MGPPNMGGSRQPVKGGRGQAVGLYVRLLWRGTTALPIRRHCGYLRVAIPSGARS